MLINIEGIDGAGKTTTIEELKGLLSREFRYYKDPGSTEFGEYARELLVYDPNLSSTSRLLLHLATRSVLHDRIDQNEKGVINIVDRGVLSTLAYNCPDKNSQRELLQAHSVLGLRVPDVIIYIDVSSEVALERIKQRGEVETLENLMALKERYTTAIEVVSRYCRVLSLPSNMYTSINAQNMIQRVTRHFLFQEIEQAGTEL